MLQNQIIVLSIEMGQVVKNHKHLSDVTVQQVTMEMDVVSKEATKIFASLVVT